MNTMLGTFLSGFGMGLYLVASLFFTRFWQRTHDRLFAGFAISFALLAIERAALLATWEADETKTWVYLIRMFAFLVLIFAVVDKNRASSRPQT